MFDGKKFLPTTGTPIRKIDFMISAFALAEPEPLTFANLRVKSFTRGAALLRSGIGPRPRQVES